jgi:hypothetical protein
MPIDFAAFTADRRVSARLFLADDRLSDMLNSVGRIVLRDATVEDLLDQTPARQADLTLPIGDLVVVVGTGPRGGETPRRRTVRRRITVGLGRFVVSGDLHLPADGPPLPEGEDPARVLAGRDMLVPLTSATINFDAGDAPMTEDHEAILFNRARATWIDLDAQPTLDPEPEEAVEPGTAGWRDRHATYLKDFTRTVAD